MRKKLIITLVLVLVLALSAMVPLAARNGNQDYEGYRPVLCCINCEAGYASRLECEGFLATLRFSDSEIALNEIISYVEEMRINFYVLANANRLETVSEKELQTALLHDINVDPAMSLRCHRCNSTISTLWSEVFTTVRCPIHLNCNQRRTYRATLYFCSWLLCDVMFSSEVLVGVQCFPAPFSYTEEMWIDFYVLTNDNRLEAASEKELQTTLPHDVSINSVMSTSTRCTICNSSLATLWDRWSITVRCSLHPNCLQHRTYRNTVHWCSRIGCDFDYFFTSMLESMHCFPAPFSY